ncbi:hypothetical protein STEG23_004000, partial [Scotinomys teguina]
GRVTPCPAPFLSSLGHRSDNPKRAHHNRAVYLSRLDLCEGDGNGTPPCLTG